jgi:hypothetical protein
MANPYAAFPFITRDDLNNVSESLGSEIIKVREELSATLTSMKLILEKMPALHNLSTPTTVAINTPASTNLFDLHPNDVLSDAMKNLIRGTLHEQSLASLSLLHFKELDAVRLKLTNSFHCFTNYILFIIF